jgi:hypothetical protein
MVLGSVSRQISSWVSSCVPCKIRIIALDEVSQTLRCGLDNFDAFECLACTLKTFLSL